MKDMEKGGEGREYGSLDLQEKYKRVESKSPRQTKKLSRLQRREGLGGCGDGSLHLPMSGSRKQREAGTLGAKTRWEHRNCRIGICLQREEDAVHLE